MVGAVAPVEARSLIRDLPDTRLGHPDRLCDALCGKAVVRAALVVDGRSGGRHVCDSVVRSCRAVKQIGGSEGGGHRPRGLRETGFDIAHLRDEQRRHRARNGRRRPKAGLRSPQSLLQVANPGQQRRRSCPAHLELSSCFDRVPFVGGDDTDEVRDLHDSRPMDVLDRALVDRKDGLPPTGQRFEGVVRPVGTVGRV